MRVLALVGDFGDARTYVDFTLELERGPGTPEPQMLV